MAADETFICNLALAHLGQSAIMSLDDASPAARYCKRFYAQTRDEVTAEAQWNFAIARVALAQLTTPPVSGWAFAYALPTDCLRALDVDGLRNFSVEAGTLVSDVESVTLRYIRRVADANKFPPLFIKAVAVKLAVVLSQPLTGSRQNEESFLSQYERIVGPDARRADAVEGRPKRRMPAYQDSDLVRSRFGRF